MPEWCGTTIQDTSVSLLSALETGEPAPKARVLPSQGWAPAPAPPPPGSAPGLTNNRIHTAAGYRAIRVTTAVAGHHSRPIHFTLAETSQPSYQLHPSRLVPTLTSYTVQPSRMVTTVTQPLHLTSPATVTSVYPA